MSRVEKQDTPRQPSPEDHRDAAIRSACASALIDWMKKGGADFLSRRFRTLKRQEAEHMAQAVISEWVVQASRRVAIDPDANTDLRDVLMGG